MHEEIYAEVKLLQFSLIGDELGYLTPIEAPHNVPFDIKRVYYIYGTKSDIVRGHHAHKQLKQVLIAVSGSVDVTCEHHNITKTYRLSSPCQGLLVGGMVWHTMQNFSKDAVLLVLASDFYDELDYIRDYSKFSELMGKSV